MSTIVNLRPDHEDPGCDGFRANGNRSGRLGSVSVRTRVALHRHGLTRALAEGADPATRPELSLRAAQLTSKRNRRGLARTLRRASPRQTNRR